MSLLFAVVDVFTEAPFAGNPLAIVFDEAEKSVTLAPAQMQALAREMNLSETIFITGWDWAEARVSVRIFTPSTELPFAGHPIIGAAAWLAGRFQARGHRLEAIEVMTPAGLVRCTAQWSNGAGQARLTPPQLPVRLDAATTSAENIAAELGLTPAAIVGDVEVWSAGLPVHCLQFDTPDRLDQITPPALNGSLNALDLSCFAYGPGTDDITSRVFPLKAGVAEDPATGAAAVALAGRLAATTLQERAQATITIHQGAAMGRASILRLHLSGANGRLSAVQLAGNVVAVSQGRWLRVPSTLGP